MQKSAEACDAKRMRGCAELTHHAPRSTSLAEQEFNFTVDCSAIGGGRISVSGTQNAIAVSFTVANVTVGRTIGVAASGVCTGLATVRGANGTVDSRLFTVRVQVGRRLWGLLCAPAARAARGKGRVCKVSSKHDGASVAGQPGAGLASSLLYVDGSWDQARRRMS